MTFKSDIAPLGMARSMVSRVICGGTNARTIMSRLAAAISTSTRGLSISSAPTRCQMLRSAGGSGRICSAPSMACARSASAETR